MPGSLVTAAGLPSHQIVPLPVTSPGSLGLNLQQQNQVLPGQWAIEALNCVIDFGGRMAARGSMGAASLANAAGSIKTIFEYRTATGSSLPIVAFDGGISSSVTNPSGSSLVGTISSVASGYWKFWNFNGKCIGFQPGQKPIVMQNQSGTFSNIVESAGTAPTGGIGCAAFGRVWGIDADGQTLKFSGLLDETLWNGGDSGSINLAKVWTNGTDQATTVVAFNGCIVVFGTRHILFYGSSSPSPIGLDVTTIQLVDTIEGTGCISQLTAAPVGETDMIFVSPIGIQSIQRLLIQKSRPTTLLSKYCRDAIIQQLLAETPANVTGFYSPTNGFYALILPTSGYVWVADMRHIYTDQDGDTVSRMTRWNTTTLCGVEFYNRTTYFTASWNNKQVAQYTASGGDNGSGIQVAFQTPFLDFGPDVAARYKALKRVGALVSVGATIPINYTWYADFNPTGSSASVNSRAQGIAEWGTAQWGIDDWSGGGVSQLLNSMANGTAQYFSMRLTASVTTTFAIQQINMLVKLLRLA